MKNTINLYVQEFDSLFFLFLSFKYFWPSFVFQGSKNEENDMNLNVLRLFSKFLSDTHHYHEYKLTIKTKNSSIKP